MNDEEHIETVADAELRIFVLAPAEDESEWAAHEIEGATFRHFDDDGDLHLALLDEGADVVIVALRFLLHSGKRRDHIVESIRSISAAGVILEGDFAMGARLPGNGDASLKPNSDSLALEAAIDASLRMARSRAMAANERAFMESLLDSMQTLVFSVDGEGKVREFNRACEVTSGFSIAQVYGRPFSDILRENEELDRALEQTSVESLPSSMILELKTADGGHRTIDASFSPFFDRLGDLYMGVVTGIDITDQRAFQQALKESERAFRNLVEAAPDAVCVFAQDSGEWLYANPAAVKLLGATDTLELFQHHIFDLIPDSEAASTRERIAEIIASGERNQATELRLNRVDGEQVWVETVEIPIRYKHRRAVLTISRDLTDRKELTARMMQVDRMVAVGTLAAGVGHEINNPLAYLSSNIEYANDEIRDAIDGRKDVSELAEVVIALEEARDGANRVRNIVRDLKDLSASESGRIEAVDIESLLESALNVAWHEIRTRANVERDFHPVPLVNGHGGRIRQLFVNILVNAAQAIPEGDPEGHTIQMKIARSDDGYVQVIVSDEGRGIPEEDLRRVFDPFFTTKAVGSGTGLGLTIAQRIVDSLGGRISIESELGRGTTVTLDFEDHSSEVSEVIEREPQTAVPIRVLLLDDELLIASSVRRALPEDSEVVAFSSGRDALEHLEEDDDFDAVLCDLIMPNMSGAEFFAALSSSHPGLVPRVVFMTGGAYSDSAATFAEEIGDRLLEKPFAAWDLRDALFRAATS